MGDGGTEEGINTVTEELRNGALVGIDRFADTLMESCNDVAPIFRIHGFGDGRGADDVGEEDRDRFSLPTQSCFSQLGLEASGSCLLEIT